MKKRKRGAVVFVRESHLGERVGRRPCEIALAIVIQHLLETGARGPSLAEISITFTEGKIRIRASGRAWIIVEIFLIFRNSEVVQFAGEERVRVFELASRRRFRIGC